MTPPTPRSSRFETRDGVDLHCLEWGAEIGPSADAPAPVILLHGGGANAHWWDQLAATISLERRVYALDFRGHGDSEYPTRREVGAFNFDLESLVVRLAREDVILVGHSLGAAVALDHASRFPATRGLLLVDLARGSERGSRRRARLALALRRTYRTREEAIERFRFLPETSHPSEVLRVHIAQSSVRREDDGRFGYKFDPAWFSLPSKPRPDLASVGCPTLLVRGSDSALLSKQAAAEFVAALPRGRFVEIADAGHHVLIDQPESLLAAIGSLISEADEAATEDVK